MTGIKEQRRRRLASFRAVAAIVSPPIHTHEIHMQDDQMPVLVTADVYFQDPELAGMPVVRMRGDSMGKTLRDGDFAIIDTTQTNVDQGGLFALLDDNDKMIIMQVTPVHGSQGKRILCTYANPRYAPFELTLGTEARIVGRVAHKFTRYL